MSHLQRVLLIAASILAACKLAQYDSRSKGSTPVSAIADRIRWAEQIMEEEKRFKLRLRAMHAVIPFPELVIAEGSVDHFQSQNRLAFAFGIGRKAN
jgi:hypothetical protein